MGIVYHAVDPNIGRPVAIKTIRLSEFRDPQEQAKLRERLFREARSAGMLSHPGIVTIYDVEQEGDIAWIAMELVDGPTLDDVLSRDSAIPVEQMFSLLSQTAAALDYAHSKGIVHRDIKPANIMISGDGTTKITDFGIAKITASEQFTMTGTIVGTPHYMSPEQVQGKPVDGRSDQFSLAVIAYEMITGEKPFTGEHLTTVVYKIVAEEPPPAHRVNATINSQIESALHRGLSKRPDQRCRTCSEFISTLEKACTGTRGWKPVARGGSLAMPTVADTPPPVTLAPPMHKRRVGVTTTDTTQARRSGFLPFLFAILVAAGLLALIGWQAAPWLQQQTSARSQATAPSTPAAANPSPLSTPTQAAPGQPPPAAPQPAPTAAVQESGPPASVQPPAAEKRPSPMSAPAETPRAASKTAPPVTHPESSAAEPESPLPSQPLRPRTAGRTAPVSIVTSPAGAAVVLDGQPESLCKSPCSIEAAPGRHALSISLPGYETEQREVVVGNNPQELPLVTLRAPGGTLMLTSAPSGASIVINGRRWNQATPAQITLAPGTYNVTVEKDGRQATRSVDVRNGIINYLRIPIE
jgi:serine/threonine-protein kinase